MNKPEKERVTGLFQAALHLAGAEEKVNSVARVSSFQ